MTIRLISTFLAKAAVDPALSEGR